MSKEPIVTYRAEVGEDHAIRLPKDADIQPGSRVLVLVLEAKQEVSETTLLSEPSLAEYWNRPEEDEAWSSYQ